MPPAAPLPPPDRLALALWRRGAEREALEIAQAAISRGDPRWTHCRALVDQMRRRERPDASEPVPTIDLSLIGAMLEAGQLFEARAVLRGAKLDDPMAARLRRVLDAALAPFPGGADPSFGSVLGLIRAGRAASALRALEEVARQNPAPPRWLSERLRALTSLVQGGWRHEPEPVEEITRDTVLDRIRARDLTAALEAAKTAHARELAEVLERLVAATERVLTDSMPDSDDPETVPMQGHRLAELHVRMGALGEADRTYRALLRDQPEDERARAMLADVVVLRRALGEEASPMPPRPSASVEWLKKNAPRAAGGWAKGNHKVSWEGPEEDSTANLDASQEAELLLKLGKAEQALDVYRILSIRHPKQQAYRKRIAEIEALIAQRMTPIAGEMTAQHDLSALSEQAIPTHHKVRLADFAGFDEVEEGPTKVDKLRRDDD